MAVKLGGSKEVYVRNMISSLDTYSVHLTWGLKEDAGVVGLLLRVHLS
jgi:hypothetical protein